LEIKSGRIGYQEGLEIRSGRIGYQEGLEKDQEGLDIKNG